MDAPNITKWTTPSITPVTDTDPVVQILLRTVKGMRDTIKDQDEVIRKLKDDLKAAARTISGDQVVIAELQKRILHQIDDPALPME